jgi:hypothetical protein
MNEFGDYDVITMTCAECGDAIEVSEREFDSGEKFLCMCCAWGIDDDDKIDC